jgi:hypothetical protein
MLRNRIRTTLLAVVALTTATFILAPAALPRAEADPPATAYSLTVVNQSRVAIYYKIVGGIGKPFVHATLDPNAQMSLPATGGEKVLCVWNMQGNLLAAWRLVVGGDRTITIPDIDPSDHTNFCDLGNGAAPLAPAAPPQPMELEKAPYAPVAPTAPAPSIQPEKAPRP